MSNAKFDMRDFNQAALNEVLKSLSDYFISKNRLKIRKKTVGKGGYGTVRLGELRSGSRFRFLDAPTIVAVKELQTDGRSGVPLRTAVRLAREMKVWASCKHKNIVEFIGYYLSSDFEQAYLISPYMKNGNIKDYIAARNLSVEARLELVQDTITGLQYLHSREPPIVHGDLKAVNVLIDDEGIALLSDFGLARAMMDEPTGLTTSTGVKGTTRYCSPEVLNGRPLERESDMWSWGCLVLEIITDNSPYYEYHNEGRVVSLICGDEKTRKTPEPSNMPPLPRGVLPLLRECWNFEPSQRPDATKCDEKFRMLGMAHHFDFPLELYVLRRNIRFLENPPNSVDGVHSVQVAALSPEDPSHSVVEVRMKTVQMFHDADLKDIGSKLRLSSRLEHRNLLGFIGYSWEHDVGLYIIEPYLRNGNLLMHLRGRELELLQRLKLLQDMLKGLQYLHSSVINQTHGALSPWTVQIDDEGGAVLSDVVFDFTGARSEFTSQSRCYIMWCSPEARTDSRNSSAPSDMWSWACVVLQVMCEQRPFDGVSIHSPDFLAFLHDLGPSPETYPEPVLPTQLLDLVRKCWSPDPGMRPSASYSSQVLDLIIQEESTLAM